MDQVTPKLKERVTYEISLGRHGWTSRIKKESAKRLLDRVSTPPDEDFFKAMELCCNWFYPTKNPDKRPWRQHERRGPVVLEEEVEKSRPLDWYWKILTTSFRELAGIRALGTICIRVSQVRHWVMLTVYRKDRDRKILLRAPVFGRSERITEWDQYWLYLANAKNIADAWKEAAPAGDLEQAYVLGRHDVEYELSYSHVKKVGDHRTPKFEVSMGGTLIPSAYNTCPYDFIDVPTFRNRRSKKDVRLLLASDQFCRALQSLSDVWNDRTINILHVNAPPGSGKEELAKTIYHFREYGENEFKPVSLSPQNPTNNEYTLFGRPKWVPTSRRSATELEYHEGFVKETKRGVLVLDEIDKIDKETRTILLRLLETGQYVLPGTNEMTELKEEERPCFVFLSSKPLNEVYACAPRDFWTRIPVVIELEHPFNIEEKHRRCEVLYQYFWLFWNEHTGPFFDRMGINAGGQSERRLDGIAKSVLEYHRHVRALFESREFITLVGRSVAKELSARYRIISVRNVRTIAQRCLLKLAEWIIHSRPVAAMANSALTDQERKIRETLERTIWREKYSRIMDETELRYTIENIARDSLEERVDYPS